MQTDPEIKVNILTPTSDRKDLSISDRNTDNTFINQNFFITIETKLPRRRYSSRRRNYMNIYDYDIIIDNSLYRDNELNRNDNVRLNINTRDCKDEDLTETCNICQENFSSTDTIANLECNHCFHSDCLIEWEKYKQECPSCRRVIPTINY